VLMSFTTTQSTLGTAAGSNPLITQGGTPFAGADSHFTYFQRLQDGQATGTDAQICEQVRTLKDSLPGEANDLPVSATIESETGLDLRGRIASTLVGSGFELLELRGVNLSLEEIFLQLTTEEPQQAPAGESSDSKNQEPENAVLEVNE